MAVGSEPASAAAVRACRAVRVAAKSDPGRCDSDASVPEPATVPLPARCSLPTTCSTVSRGTSLARPAMTAL